MAIEVLRSPVGMSGGPDAGMFSLPPAFDTKRYAAEWVESGSVAMKQQRQTILQAGLTADGWEVWKENPNSEPTVVNLSGNKKFVLMCRPKEIQNKVNAIYGNVSKSILAREIKGETVTVPTPQGSVDVGQDPGILPEEKLKKVLGGEFSGGGDVQLNEIEKSAQFDNVTAAQET